MVRTLGRVRMTGRVLAMEEYDSVPVIDHVCASPLVGRVEGRNSCGDRKTEKLFDLKCLFACVLLQVQIQWSTVTTPEVQNS